MSLEKPRYSLDTPVQYLKGVGPKNAMLLARLDLNTAGDLLYHFPRRHEDRRHIPPIAHVQPGNFATVKGHISRVDGRPGRRGMVILRATVADRTGSIDLVWFNQPWIKRKLVGYEGEIIAYGMVKETHKAYEINSPEIEMIDDDDDIEEFARLVPVYPSTEGVQQKVIRRASKSAVDYYLDAVEEPLPTYLLKENGLIGIKRALKQMHYPDSEQERLDARRRLVFEEFFYMQLALQIKRSQTKQELGISFPISTLAGKEDHTGNLFSPQTPLKEGETLWDEVHRMLPFELTGAQKRVINEIWADMERPLPMNRLVQGDVGSGKTAVAACAMLAAVRCGYQAALMAPTEILAEQHYINLHRLLDPLGIHVHLLCGKMNAPTKRRAIQAAASGEARIAIGTHALIQEGVTFARLGLAVIDEQHRFGVMQRAALRQKADENPDVLVMTATPIPRTLTMTLYGDLDLSVIDELPPGRKPIKSYWKMPSERPSVYAGVRTLIEEGCQAYFVCPMISDSEKMQTQAAQDLFLRLSAQEFSGLKVGLLHGQMKPAEKEEVMLKFRSKELDILVSTVVIEVGVDVPNATVMVIEDANRFGLSQLHQLRGRVGRGERQSYCLLIADAKTEEARQRMSIISQTSDGFAIAEADLRLRGPGEIAGTRQSGNLDFKLADLVQDGKLLEVARQAAMQTVERDPDLSEPQHLGLRKKIKEQRAEVALVTVS